MTPTTEDFRRELRRQLSQAKALGKKSVDVNAGELHRDIGGYPGQKHRMPACCDAMIAEMGINDRVVDQPPKGKGASLTVRYVLR